MNSFGDTTRAWLARLGLAGIFVLAVVAAIFLSAIFFAVFLVLALVGSIAFWWNMRRLRREAEMMQQEFEEGLQTEDLHRHDDDIVEVEYRVLEHQHRETGPDRGD